VFLKSVAAILAAAALYAGIQRLSGPSVTPIPAALPHVVRRPPPLGASRDSASDPVNPDPQVRQLHAQGITGRGIGIAVIDSFLLTDHQEYRDRLRWYDEIDGWRGDPAGWHGTAVASIAVGRSVGVAPEADLYFVGLGVIWANQPVGSWFAAPGRAVHTGQHQALAIRRILEINRRLETDRKIRVISMSIGWGPRWLSDTAAAVDEARRVGILVSTIDLGAPRYGPVRIASAAAPDRYITVGAAGSWSMAYWAGRYALACQQDPSMTPERFRVRGESR
jgi:subtilisin family serine protease